MVDIWLLAHPEEPDIPPVIYDRDDTQHVQVHVPDIGDSGNSMIELVHTWGLYLLPLLSLIIIGLAVWNTRETAFVSRKALRKKVGKEFTRPAKPGRKAGPSQMREYDRKVRERRTHITAKVDAIRAESSDSKVIMAVGTIPLLIWLFIGASPVLVNEDFSTEETDKIASSLEEKWGVGGITIVQGVVPSSEVTETLTPGYGVHPIVCQVSKSAGRFDYSTATVDASCVYSRNDLTPAVPWVDFPNVDEDSVQRKPS